MMSDISPILCCAVVSFLAPGCGMLVFFFFWIIKNLLPKGESPKPTKKKQVAKSYQNKQKTGQHLP